MPTRQIPMHPHADALSVTARRRAFAFVTAIILLVSVSAVGADVTIDVWPADVPGESAQSEEFRQKVAEAEARNTDERVFGISRATITVRLAPPATACGTAVLICPGGGYNVLAWDKEGLEVADWLNSLGVHAFVLKYRVPRREPDFSTPPLQDAQRAMRIIRSRAAEWKIEPDRIGVLGFSAGGNLSVNLALATDASYPAIDEVDTMAFHPDFMIPVYAAYLGAPDNDQILNPELAVDKNTPPAFLVVTQDDKNRGIHAALFFAELTRAGVPAEVHVFLKGGHGYGLRPGENPVSHWPDHCARWMQQLGLLTRR